MAYEYIEEPAGRYQYLDDSQPTAPTAPVSRTDKVLRGMRDPLDGAAQLFENMMPAGFNKANHTVNNWLADKTGLLSAMPSGGIGEFIGNGEKAYQSQRAAAGESGFDGYRAIGNTISPVNLVAASKLPVAASLLGRIGVGAAGGAASAALNPVTEGDFWSEKGKQVAVGGAFGGAVPVLTGALARVIKPNASVNPNLKILKNEGVQPTIGQTLGGWVNALEEKAQSLPLVGDAITAARQRAKEQFNNAAINRASGKVGEAVDGHGSQAVAEAGNKISDAYSTGKQMLGNFRIDQQGAQELATLKQMAGQLQPRERSVFNKLYATFQSELTPQGHLLPDGFKRLDSKLTAEHAKFSGSGDAYQKELGDALMEMQRVIVENAKRANPSAAKALNDADAAWANLVRVEGAATAAKGTGGVFTPGQLLTAVRGSDKSVRDRATARGTALMQDLGNAGQSVLGNKVPDSGTAGRLMLGGGALGSYLINPAIPAGLLAGAAAYAPAPQSLLRGLASNRGGGQFAESAAEALRQTSPFLIPGGAQFGLGLLNQ